MDFIGMQPDTEFKAYLGLIQKKQHVQWMPQTDFILDQDGTLLVDKIGRLESIEKDSNEVFGILDVCREQAKNFHANPSERKTLDHYYDQESVEMVGEIYSSDINYLNYSFDSMA